MSNIWSDNRKLEIAINILLFLVAINFLHYGQLLLPFICLLLFIDNKYKFNVKNKAIFILLCLFGLAFFAFSYKLGFYSVMGFCMPMSYYIGTNIKNPSKENIKKLIYLLAYGMIAHIFLNIVCSYMMLGDKIFLNQGHYDVWTKTKLAATAIAVNYVFLIGCMYYNIFYEKNKKLKTVTCAFFIIAIIYNLFLGRRTPIFILLISFVLSGFVDIVIYRKSKRLLRIASIVLLSILFFSVLLCFAYTYLANQEIKDRIIALVLVKKFINEGLSSGRLEILIDTIKLMPLHLWGGEEISTIIGIRPHDLLTDIYNYAGIIPFVIMMICSTYGIITVYKTIKENNDIEFKLLLIPLFTAILLQMMLEPVMTGSSLFLINVIILISSLEKHNES